MKLYMQLVRIDGNLGDKMPIEVFVARDGQPLPTDPEVEWDGKGPFIAVQGSPEPTWNTVLGKTVVRGQIKGVLITVGE